ncbi:MAG: hypothetical protein JST51_05160 [Armatimonadetes bacterium]|nr:hypothetical protein [Armatimonadota bacterium]
MTASKKRRTWKRAGTVFGVVLTFLLSVAVIAYWQTGIPGPAAQLEKNRKLAKANGLALTKSDYERMFAVPDSQNAVAFFPAEKPPELKPVSSASPKELEATWKLIEPKVRKMEAALEKPHFRLFQGREAMNSTDFGESRRPVAWVREFMRVADRDISLGNLPRAKRILMLGASLCIKMMDDPSCLAGQYSLSCESILSNSLKRILFAHPTDQAWLKLAWDVATRLDVERPMRPAVISECRIRVLS